MRLRPVLLSIIGIVVLGSAVFYLVNSSPKINLRTITEQLKQNEINRDAPQGRNLTYTHVEDGLKKWTVSAQNGDYDIKKDIVSLDGVLIVFYQEGNQMELVGDKAVFDQKRQHMVITGNVKGKDQKGSSMLTEQIVYDERNKIVETDKLITILGENYKLVSKGMTLYLPTEVIHFKSEVELTITPEEKET